MKVEMVPKVPLCFYLVVSQDNTTGFSHERKA